MLQTQNSVFWSRVSLENGIAETSFNNSTVELLRNQAKISVTNEASNFTYDGFTIHNTPEKGTVAPYSPDNGFMEGTVSEPSNVALVAAQNNNINCDGATVGAVGDVSAAGAGGVDLDEHAGLEAAGGFAFLLDGVALDENGVAEGSCHVSSPSCGC